MSAWPSAGRTKHEAVPPLPSYARQILSRRMMNKNKEVFRCSLTSDRFSRSFHIVIHFL
jgi:hypothetical protein